MKKLLGFVVFLLCACINVAYSDVPKVVATIKPVHSLVAAVMKGVGEPYLVVKNFQSPHTYQILPSDANAFNDADLVLWLGPQLETGMASFINQLANDARIVELSEINGLVKLENRSSDIHVDDDEHHEDEDNHDESHQNDHNEDDHDEHDHGQFDMHMWLDLDNAKTFALEIARNLSEMDTENQLTYQSNANDLVQRLSELDQEFKEVARQIQEVPYITFHDAYQYLDTRYNLNFAGSITPSPEQSPSAKTIRELEEYVAAHNRVCIFHEPQFPLSHSILDAISKRKNTRLAALDPLGSAVHPGPDAYFKLMREIVYSLSACMMEVGKE